MRRVLARPLVSIVGFNVAMVLWHIPGPFDLAATNQWVHIGLEHGSFFALGIAFWLQIFGSQPFRPVLPEPRRVVALISTNAVMVVVAASLVLFSKTAYPAYAAILGHSQQVADQQVGGAILWVCGELIFLPAILYLIAQWLREPERPMDVGVRTGSSASRGSVA